MPFGTMIVSPPSIHPELISTGYIVDGVCVMESDLNEYDLALSRAYKLTIEQLRRYF